MYLFFSFSLYGKIKKVIEQWQPRDCKTEKAFQESLMKALELKFGDKTRIEKEYGFGKQRVDVVVQDKVPIELKFNLKSSALIHQTIGQLEQYSKNKTWEHVFLIVCGQIAPHRLQVLKEFAQSKSTAWDNPEFPRILVFTKP